MFCFSPFYKTRKKIKKNTLTICRKNIFFLKKKRRGERGESIVGSTGFVRSVNEEIGKRNKALTNGRLSVCVIETKCEERERERERERVDGRRNEQGVCVRSFAETCETCYITRL